jgi:hypothetical protein
MSRARNILLVSVLFLAGILITEDAMAQRGNKYKRRKNKSKNISNYRGGVVGGKFRPYSWAGASINALNYYGDMAPLNRAASTDISFTRPGFGLSYSYLYHQRFAVRGNLSWGLLRGDDNTADFNEEANAPRYYRNLSFRNNIWELSGGVQAYLFPEFNGPTYRNAFNFYLFVGVGVISHNPKGLVPEYDYQRYGPDAANIPAAQDDRPPQAGEWVSLRDLGTEGQNLLDGASVYSRMELVIPVAIGATVRLPGNFNAAFEIGYRHTFTDYLDDVSGSYVDYNRFENRLARIMADRSGEPVAAVTGVERAVGGQITEKYPEYWAHRDIGGGAAEGSIRGNPNDDDVYLVTQIRLTYIIPYQIRRRQAKFR